MNTRTVVEINLYEDKVKQGVYNYKNVSEKLKQKKEMYKDALINDSEYSELKEKVDQAKAELKKRQKELEDWSLSGLKTEIKNLQAQKREEQLTLSDWLVEFVDGTGQKNIEIEGQLLKIRQTAKITK